MGNLDSAAPRYNLDLEILLIGADWSRGPGRCYGLGKKVVSRVVRPHCYSSQTLDEGGKYMLRFRTLWK